MNSTPQVYQAFEDHVERILNLSHASRILDWDQQVIMPEGGTAARSQQLATLSALEHELLCSEDLSRILDELDEVDLEPIPAANVREIRRRHERAIRVPNALIERTRQVRSDAYETWKVAKSEDDFSKFASTLEELVELRREYAENVAPQRDPYSVLFEKFEPYIEFDRAEDILLTLRDEIPSLIESIQRSDDLQTKNQLKGTFNKSKQQSFVRDVLSEIGFDWGRGRFDTSPHPFQRGSPFDARLTTRFNEDDLLDGLTSAVHEFGHALYVQNLPQKHYGLPAGEPRDMVIHESQSRFWENHIGRSRGFWEHVLPVAQEYFPHLKGVSENELYRSANELHSGTPVRVEADELSYHLHIVVRFEIEKALIREELDVSEVPKVWNEKMEDYLGISPKSESEGVLQDVHWSNGAFGYFPTYSLGSAAAAQFRDSFEQENGSLEKAVRNDGFELVTEWLRENIHRHGKRYRTDDLIKEATGDQLQADPFIDYLHGKYGRLYNN